MILNLVGRIIDLSNGVVQPSLEHANLLLQLIDFGVAVPISPSLHLLEVVLHLIVRDFGLKQVLDLAPLQLAIADPLYVLVAQLDVVGDLCHGSLHILHASLLLQIAFHLY